MGDILKNALSTILSSSLFRLSTSRLISRFVAFLHRAHREAVFGEVVGLLRECVVVGGGQQVEDAVVVVEAVVVRKQCPVGGQRVGESGAGVGDNG